MKLCPGIQELLNVKGEFLVKICRIFVVWVLRQVILIGQERTHAAKLQDALAAIHHGQLIPAHELFATMSSDELKKQVTIKEIYLS